MSSTSSDQHQPNRNRTAVIQGHCQRHYHSKANDAMKNIQGLGSHRVVGTTKMTNGGLLLEMNTEKSAQWMKSKQVQLDFIKEFDTAVKIKPWTFTCKGEFILLSFEPDP